MKKKHIYLIITVILGLGFFNSWLASSFPDGLERTASDLGFIEQSRTSLAFFEDYLLPLENSLLSSGLAGLLGILITYLLLSGISRIIIKTKERSLHEKDSTRK